MSRFKLLGGILSILLMLGTCTAEVYTALAEMEELLDTEAVLIANLVSYVDAQEEKLNYLRRWAEVLQLSVRSIFHKSFMFAQAYSRISKRA